MTGAADRLPLLAAIVAAACGGSQAPPPPVATPSPAQAVGGPRPISSRDAAAGTTTASPATQPTLPPGHPPIGGAPGSADAGALPPGHPAIGDRPSAAGQLGGQPRPTRAISGTIVLSPRLQGRVTPADVLYIMAKKGSATLAVRREEHVRFPFPFEISRGDAMVAGTGFEGPIDLVARLSRSGDAIPSKGDLEGATKGVTVPAKGVTVTIERVRD